jgi:hypothetical protein
MDIRDCTIVFSRYKGALNGIKREIGAETPRRKRREAVIGHGKAFVALRKRKKKRGFLPVFFGFRWKERRFRALCPPFVA